MPITPTDPEVKRWLTETLQHSYRVEYFLHLFKIGDNDPQRPHDIIGLGNKFSWEVIKGLALQYRINSFSESYAQKMKKEHIHPAVKFHRRHQYHHQMWNGPSRYADLEDLKVGAVDSLCSLLEDRPYQGGSHSFADIMNIIKENTHPKKVGWMWVMFSRMKVSYCPHFEDITLDYIPNLHLSNEIHRKMVDRTKEAIEMLEEKGYKF